MCLGSAQSIGRQRWQLWLCWIGREKIGKIEVGSRFLLFVAVAFDGLDFSVLQDPIASGTMGSLGEFGWGGAASTAFWIDPVEQIDVISQRRR